MKTFTVNRNPELETGSVAGNFGEQSLIVIFLLKGLFSIQENAIKYNMIK